MLYWPIPKKGISQKLAPKWEGPFTVIDQLGPVTYRLRNKNKVTAAHVQRMKHYEDW